MARCQALGLIKFSKTLFYALLLLVLFKEDVRSAYGRVIIPRHPPFQQHEKYGISGPPSTGVFGSGGMPSADGKESKGRPTPLSRCTEKWRDAKLDHFSFPLTTEIKTFKQRFFVCQEHWRPGGSILFYAGNEADVTLYLNNTGLLWELAPHFNSLIVWAEHRYYGKSKPFGMGGGIYRNATTMAWLTTEQAMADYAELIFELKQQLNDTNVPVIVAGGSYGGMLAAWMRLKYPHLVDGALAASAPIWTYFYEDPPWDPGSFAEIVTRDASPNKPADAAPACVPNARKAWQLMFDMGHSRKGRERLGRAMRLCKGSTALQSLKDVEDMVDWAAGAWDYLAMGNYPYPSSYILSGEGTLPAYPVRVACQHLGNEDLDGEELLSSMRRAIGVFYNATGKARCFDVGSGEDALRANEESEDFWSWQWCTEQFMPMTRDGKRDMFWDQPFDMEEAASLCEKKWGVRPQAERPTVEWGGRRILAGSNIVFTNGGLDPWSAGGVVRTLSPTMIAVVIPEGAHHLDLMWSNDEDPDSVKIAREVQAQEVERWIREARHSKPTSDPSVALDHPGAGWWWLKMDGSEVSLERKRQVSYARKMVV